MLSSWLRMSRRRLLMLTTLITLIVVLSWLKLIPPYMRWDISCNDVCHNLASGRFPSVCFMEWSEWVNSLGTLPRRLVGNRMLCLSFTTIMPCGLSWCEHPRSWGWWTGLVSMIKLFGVFWTWGSLIGRGPTNWWIRLNRLLGWGQLYPPGKCVEGND